MEPLLWLLLEAGIALALLLLIVWWTWPRKKSAEGQHAQDRKASGAPGRGD